MRTWMLATCALIAAPASAADEASPRIVVSGTGHASTAPDRAIIGYGVHGEGATSDEAVSAMVVKRKAIDGGLASFGGKPAARANTVSIAEVRGRDCNRAPFVNTPRLSTGECAIVGYTADLAMEVTTAQVKDAGTIVGLVGRLGGQNPRLQRFFLADDELPRRRALANAFDEAKRQAEAIAAAAGVKLGALVSATDGSFMGRDIGEVIVTASAVAPPPPPPPIAVEITPRLIETQARVTLGYAILP